MLLRALAAAAAIALSVSASQAGKTPSHTIVPAADEPAVCDPYVFDYAVNYSFTWANTGQVHNWFLLTAPNIEAFITLWNNIHPDNKIPEGLKFDAVVGFTLDPGSEIGGDPGDYVFLYSGGCYVADVFAPPAPDNASPPPPVKVQYKSLKQWHTLGYIGLA